MRRPGCGDSAGQRERANVAPARHAAPPRAARRSPRRTRARSRGRARRPLTPAAAALERLEERARARPPPIPGPLVDDRDTIRRPAGVAVTRTRTEPSGARTCSAFSIRFTSTRSIWTASTRAGGARRPRASSRRRAPASCEGVHARARPPPTARRCGSRRPGLEPREVEQVRRPGARAAPLDADRARAARARSALESRPRRSRGRPGRSASSRAAMRKSWETDCEDRRLHGSLTSKRFRLDGASMPRSAAAGGSCRRDRAARGER